jgi:hypothetical protein
MGGSAKAPKESDSARASQKLQDKLMKEQLRQAQMPAKVPEIKVPKPLPPPPPPAATVSGDVAQAEEDSRRKAGQRTNTARKTLFAGETGGYKGTLGGGKTLLG